MSANIRILAQQSAPTSITAPTKTTSGLHSASVSGSASATNAATTDAVVKNRLRQVALGNSAAVREELPSLQAKYKNDPGIDFLAATLAPEPQKAQPIFERIVRHHPQSLWADDAQWRIVQFHALQRDTSRARAALQDFRRLYPNSEFLLFAAEIVKTTVGLPPSFVGRPASSPIASEQSPALSAALEASESERPVTTKTLDTPGQRYTLQIGVYSSEQNAAAEVQKLIKARMRADVIEKKLGDHVRFAVIVGDYSSRETAEKARAIVAKYTKALPMIIPKPEQVAVAQ
jgi:septal ring-binding cell division protein DamX